MTYATIFSGIGGWEIGLNAAGWQLKWQCECDPFCRAVLAERFGVPVHSDVRTLLDDKPEPVECIVGSPPCQPFSVAGQKHGVADRRHLYPAFIAAVRVLRPRWVLMENVAGLVSDRGAFGQYIGGLAEIGFDLCWHCIPASAVGANHQRDRLWIIAYAASARCKDRQNTGTGRSDATTDECGGGDGRHPDQPGLEKRRPQSPAFTADNWSVEPDVGRVANGVPLRVDRLKALGNAVVPQIPFLIASAINKSEGCST